MVTEENIPIAYEIESNVLESPHQVIVVAHRIDENESRLNREVFHRTAMDSLTRQQKRLLCRKFIESSCIVIIVTYGLIYFINM